MNSHARPTPAIAITLWRLRWREARIPKLNPDNVSERFPQVAVFVAERASRPSGRVYRPFQRQTTSAFLSLSCFRFRRAYAVNKATSPGPEEFTLLEFLISRASHNSLEKTSVDTMLSIRLSAERFSIAICLLPSIYFSLAAAPLLRLCRRLSVLESQSSHRSRLLRPWQWNLRANATRP